MLDSSNNKYGLLNKCEDEMAGSRPSSFFSVFMARDTVEVHKLAKKKNEYQAILTEPALSIKDMGFRDIFLAGLEQCVEFTRTTLHVCSTLVAFETKFVRVTDR